MILDLVLKDNVYLLKIHKNFFRNNSLPISLFQQINPLMEKYSYLGLFHLGGLTFGFDGCFKRLEENGDYIVYGFNFPGVDNREVIRKMLLTIYLSTYYVVETIFYEKEFFSETVWDDQSLSFTILDGGSPTNGYSIGGQIYVWFKKKLNSLSDEKLAILNQYVFSELNRISIYFFGEELCYSQITITRESFFMQVNMGGRWLSWNLGRSMNKREEFSSHNIDFRSDQELCFAAIIAINTWLREN